MVVGNSSNANDLTTFGDLRFGVPIRGGGSDNENGEEGETGRSKLHEHSVCDLAWPVKGSHDIVTIARKIA